MGCLVPPASPVSWWSALPSFFARCRPCGVIGRFNWPLAAFSQERSVRVDACRQEALWQVRVGAVSCAADAVVVSVSRDAAVCVMLASVRCCWRALRFRVTYPLILRSCLSPLRSVSLLEKCGLESIAKARGVAHDPPPPPILPLSDWAPGTHKWPFRASAASTRSSSATRSTTTSPR